MAGEGFEFKKFEATCERCKEPMIANSKSRRFCKDCAHKRHSERTLAHYHAKKANHPPQRQEG